MGLLQLVSDGQHLSDFFQKVFPVFGQGDAFDIPCKDRDAVVLFDFSNGAAEILLPQM